MKTKTIFFFTFLISGICLSVIESPAQGVAINASGAAADPSSMLDVKSTSLGVLLPRMTTTERDLIISPAQGLFIYNTTTNCLNYYASGWLELCGSCALVPTTADAGADQLNVSGTTTTLSGNTPVSGTGMWSIVSGSGGSVNTASSPVSTFSGIAGATYTLKWTITTSCGTFSSDEVVISFTLSDTNPCIVKTFGGTGSEALAFPWEVGNMVITNDGGYVIAGSSDSYGAGNTDAWIIKLDASGAIIWQKTYGGANYDAAYSIIQTNDGGYAVTGYYNMLSAGTNADLWILKLDAGGNVIWQKTYGGANSDLGYSIIQTNDGGYAVSGKYNFTTNDGDLWVLKIDGSGNIMWQESFNGPYEDNATTIVQTNNGEYVLTGKTYTGLGSYDVWAIRLNSAGSVVWQKAYGSAEPEQSITMVKTNDGGFVLTGRIGMTRYGLLMKIDSLGNIIWQKRYGGTTEFVGECIIQTNDGGYTFVGYCDITGMSYQYILNKLDANGNHIWQRHYGGTEYEIPTTVVQTPSGNYAMAGVTKSYGANPGGTTDILFLKVATDGTGPSCTGTPYNILENITLTVVSTAVNPYITSVTPVNTSVTPLTTNTTTTNPCTCP
ncbi:MAG TPA: hypothetical protein PKW80_02155 [Bacteroidales bacterium]|nr:hypothetical protein [Bacteroidales bacterium]